jgi:hypothetical protein
MFYLNLFGNQNFNDLAFLSQISNETNKDLTLKVLPISIQKSKYKK